MTIKKLALKLIEQSEVEVYSLMRILRDMSTDEARIKTREQERHHAQKYAWKKSNVQYRQMQKNFIKHK
ncbi:MAG: hypothetical protein J6R22_05015 [Alphaproteobacteria bacterium]|nr:hypothetical protein [Alphaproteobacteria bacterium]